MLLNSKSGAENPHFHVKMAMTVLVLELQGGKKIRMSLMSSLKVYKFNRALLNNTIAGD